MCEYLPPKIFKEKYPFGERIGAGGFASVFKSGIYAIKVFDKFDKDFNDILLTIMRELSFLKILNHPCIIKPSNWTFENNTGFIALPRGIKLSEAVKNKLITKEQIITDSLDVVGYLENLGISHYDIQTSNIIYLNGRLTLIDFGCSRDSVRLGSAIFYIGHIIRELFPKEHEDIKSDKVVEHYTKFFDNVEPGSEEFKFLEEIKEFPCIRMEKLPFLGRRYFEIYEGEIPEELKEVANKFFIKKEDLDLFYYLLKECDRIKTEDSDMKFVKYICAIITSYLNFDYDCDSTDIMFLNYKYLIKDIGDSVTIKDFEVMLLEIMQNINILPLKE